MVAFFLPDTATGLISAVANTQSCIDLGCMALNSLRMAGDSACVTPSTSPLHNKSDVFGETSRMENTFKEITSGRNV